MNGLIFICGLGKRIENPSGFGGSCNKERGAG